MQLQELTADRAFAREHVRLPAVAREHVTSHRRARASAGAAPADVVPDPVPDEVDRRLVPQRVDQSLLRQDAVLATGFREGNRTAEVRGGIPIAWNVAPISREDDDRHVVRVEARQSAGGTD